MTQIDYAKVSPEEINLQLVTSTSQFPDWFTRDMLAEALHEKMQPFNDSLEDVNKGLDYVFNAEEKLGAHGGFVVLASHANNLLGALVMLKTGMEGYIPPYLLLMVYVDPVLRGKGIGKKIIDLALSQCDGDVKLHVEHQNPARRLYERLGFTSKYAEMRFVKE